MVLDMELEKMIDNNENNNKIPLADILKNRE